MKKISLSNAFLGAALLMGGFAIPYNPTPISEHSLLKIDHSVIQSRYEHALEQGKVTTLAQETEDYISLSDKCRIGFNAVHTAFLLGAGSCMTLAFMRRKEDEPEEQKTPAEPKLA